MIVLKEAISNAIESIEIRRKADNINLEGVISIKLILRKTLLEDDYICEQVSISDNGIGFTEDNVKRFFSLADPSKNLGNKGTGKIQFFHRFKTLTIKSVYRNKESILKKYEKTCGIEIDSDPIDISLKESSELITELTLQDPYCDDLKEFGKFCDIKLFKNEIIRMVLPLLIQEKSRGLIFRFSVELRNLNNNISNILSDEITEDDLPTLISEKTVKIRKSRVVQNANPKRKPVFELTGNPENISIRSYKISPKNIDTNSIFICRKNTIVTSYTPKELSSIFDKSKKNKIDGYYYLSLINGSIFDDPNNIDNESESFLFKRKDSYGVNYYENPNMLEETEGVYFWDDIDRAITPALESVFKPMLEEAQESLNEAKKIARSYGFDDKTFHSAKIAVTDGEKDIVRKLYETQGKSLADSSVTIMHTYRKLRDISAKKTDPCDENFQKSLKQQTINLLNLIPEQNKDELSKYVIRRDIVVNTLQLILDNELEIQARSSEENKRNQPEGIIHDLIFRRKSSGGLNDLWVFNEEFVHFQSMASDIPLVNIQVDGQDLIKNKEQVSELIHNMETALGGRLKRRPDIFLFTEEGACILIELKAPEVKVSEHTNQIYQYATLIANFSNIKIQKFYGYLIGGELNIFDPVQDFIQSPNGEYWFKPHTAVRAFDSNFEDPKASLYQEIIPYKALAHHARMRNKSFAQQLGIEIGEQENE